MTTLGKVPAGYDRHDCDTSGQLHWHNLAPKWPMLLFMHYGTSHHLDPGVWHTADVMPYIPDHATPRYIMTQGWLLMSVGHADERATINVYLRKPGSGLDRPCARATTSSGVLGGHKHGGLRQQFSAGIPLTDRAFECMYDVKVIDTNGNEDAVPAPYPAHFSFGINLSLQWWTE